MRPRTRKFSFAKTNLLNADFSVHTPKFSVSAHNFLDLQRKLAFSKNFTPNFFTLCFSFRVKQEPVTSRAAWKKKNLRAKKKTRYRKGVRGCVLASPEEIEQKKEQKKAQALSRQVFLGFVADNAIVV